MGLNLKGKKSSLIHKTKERCGSLGSSRARSKNIISAPSKSLLRSWPCSPVSFEGSKHKTKLRAVPEGCFSVYIGPHIERFVVKTACINHPLFRILLQEAEKEYNYNCNGSLVLPCDVKNFYNLLAELEGDGIHQGCTLTRGYSSYHGNSTILNAFLEQILIFQNW